jgi:hypothetical protein
MFQVMNRKFNFVWAFILTFGLMFLYTAMPAHAVLLTDPNDSRVWQGATVGTFAQLIYGSDTLTTRQQIIDSQLLDDGLFNPAGATPANLLATPWTGSGGGCLGVSLDSTGTGSHAYSCGGSNLFTQANTVDNLWFQSSGNIGDTVFDLGFEATKAAVFNAIDHGPFPQEAIESTVYLSDDLINWTTAVLERVWLEGHQPNTGILWDGFAFAVGTGTADTFRYASVTHGGPSALQRDGDDEINGVLGLKPDFTPDPGGNVIPEPGTMALVGLGLMGLGFPRRFKK